MNLIIGIVRVREVDLLLDNPRGLSSVETLHTMVFQRCLREVVLGELPSARVMKKKRKKLF